MYIPIVTFVATLYG